MTSHDLKQNVQTALDWEPSLDASDMGVEVDEGIVTLHGTVRSFVEKMTAERIVHRVYGVRGVANNLSVHVPKTFERTDTEIAQAVLAALEWSTLVPHDKVSITVASGWVTLTGTLEWRFQKDAAARAVRELTGVKGVTNEIVVQPQVRTGEVREKIEAAFKRSAEIDARRIHVTASDGTVILSGNVHSWAERLEAERAAWSAPGVTVVDDRLIVVP
jgi:osmotically-inducible protein OsmY